MKEFTPLKYSKYFLKTFIILACNYLSCIDEKFVYKKKRGGEKEQENPTIFLPLHSQSPNNRNYIDPNNPDHVVPKNLDHIDPNNPDGTNSKNPNDEKPRNSDDNPIDSKPSTPNNSKLSKYENLKNINDFKSALNNAKSVGEIIEILEHAKNVLKVDDIINLYPNLIQKNNLSTDNILFILNTLQTNLTQVKYKNNYALNLKDLYKIALSKIICSEEIIQILEHAKTFLQGYDIQDICNYNIYKKALEMTLQLPVKNNGIFEILKHAKEDLSSVLMTILCKELNNEVIKTNDNVLIQEINIIIKNVK